MEQVPDATTLLHFVEDGAAMIVASTIDPPRMIQPSRANSSFRHLLVEHDLGEKLLACQQKNRTGTRDPEMHQTKKGNQWHFGMKAHIGVDAGSGYVHSVTATAANVHDLDEVTRLVRDDDEVVYADAGFRGVHKRPEITADEHLSGVQWRVAAGKSALRVMHEHDCQVEARKAAVRARVEHPFLIVKRDFGFAMTRYREMKKNRNHLNVLFASANWLMRARAVALQGATA